MITPDDRSAVASLHTAAQRNRSKSVEPLKAAIAIDPTNATSYCLLGDAFAERTYLGHAQENYRRCAALTSDPTPRLRLVQTAFRLGLYDECVAAGRRLFEQGTVDGNSLFYVAVSLHYMGDHEGATRLLTRFDPNSVSAGHIRYFLARTAYAGNDAVGAAAHLRRVMPPLEDGAVRLLLNRALTMAGQDLDAHADNVPFAKTSLDNAVRLIEAGDLRQAATALRCAVYAAPWSAQVHERLDAFGRLLDDRILASSDSNERTSLWHVMEGMEAEREFARFASMPPPKAGVLIKTPRRIFDGFIFNDELDLLEHRLEEIGAAVDAMVVVESEWTFQGGQKPLIFQENSARFARFSDKIIHVAVRERCVGLAWDQEAYQRNMILRGLRDCRDDDIVLVSDVDEIPRKSVIAHLKTADLKHNDIQALSFRYFRYFMNARLPLMWMRPVALPYALLKRIGPNRARELMIKSEPPVPNVIHDAGWHFSSLGGIEAQIKKYRENSHIEIAERQPSRKSLEKSYASGRFEDEWGRLIIEGIDASFPDFVLAHRAALIERGWIWTAKDRPPEA